MTLVKLVARASTSNVPLTCSVLVKTRLRKKLFGFLVIDRQAKNDVELRTGSLQFRRGFKFGLLSLGHEISHPIKAAVCLASEALPNCDEGLF
jgi:hypothetical protein